VLAALEASGQADDTLILFTSDHGEMLGRRGLWGKYNMYDDAARVPLIVAGPGVGPGIGAGTRTDPVSLIDLAPTICEAAGLPDPGRCFSGRSLLAPARPGRTIISEYHDGGCPVGITMVRWNDENSAWKYVHYAEGHPPQLFNLTRDPDERTDLAVAGVNDPAASAAWAEARRRMAAILDPDETNTRAHADQARLVAKLGGREKLLAAPQWNFTPADSR
jgi:choline-sulfatase